MSSDAQADLSHWKFPADDDGGEADSDGVFDVSEPGAEYGKNTEQDTDAGGRRRDSTVCQNCGEPWNQSRRRQLGDNDDIMWHCPRCCSHNEIGAGAAAKPDYPVDREADSAAPDHHTTRQARAAFVQRSGVMRK